MPYHYVAYTDGGVRGGNPGVAGWGYTLWGNSNEIHRACGVIAEPATNNDAEYAALLALLRYLRDRKISDVLVFSDSQLMVNHLTGVWSVKSDSLRLTFACCKVLCASQGVQLQWIPREDNVLADKIVRDMLDEHVRNLKEKQLCS